jgi:predicted nucleotidyltransferase
MRLTDNEKREIRTAARKYFGADVYLFGSRLEDARRGGDIDLYIEAALDDAAAARARIGMLGYLYRRIGERKIDIVVNNGREDLPIYRVARQSGARL